MTNFTLANKVNLNRKKMNKKIVKALFSYAVSKEQIRPIMQGVHFEEDVCVATDTHVLVVYKASNPALAGTTKLEDGTDIKGTFPAFKRVIPKKAGTPVNYNWSQVYRAIKWVIDKINTTTELYKKINETDKPVSIYMFVNSLYLYLWEDRKNED